MKLLLAEDDEVSRRLLQGMLTRWGYEVVVTCNGQEAWDHLQCPDRPQLAILDWMMPELDGVELCRRIRQSGVLSFLYLILMTAKGGTENMVVGLDAGADDYLVKPVDRAELRARIRVGERVVGMQRKMVEQMEQLQHALDNVRQLQGLLPICTYCKKIRDDGNYWRQLEDYITRNSAATFSHGICPGCMHHVFADVQRLQQQGPSSPGNESIRANG